MRIALMLLLLLCAFQSATAWRNHSSDNTSLMRRESLGLDDGEHSGVEYNASHPLYYIPTTEGIGSRMMQLVMLRYVVHPFNRTLLVTGRPSEHDPDVMEVEMCSLIEWPGDVQCIHSSPEEIKAKAKCTIMPFLLSHNAALKHLQSIDFHDVECIGGFLAIIASVAKIHGIIDIVPYAPKQFILTPRYQQLNHTAMGALQRAAHNRRRRGNEKLEYGSGIVAVHWRRGDEVIRCKGHAISFIDYTVNCADNAEEFVDAVLEEIASLNISRSDAGGIYIATNERNETMLRQLKQAGFLLYEDLAIAVSDELGGRGASSLDIVMIEIGVMCSSQHFITWGYSSVNVIVHWCRTYLHGGRDGYTMNLIDDAIHPPDN